jgi:AbrB family looped-hinge helix DNA binding protein
MAWYNTIMNTTLNMDKAGRIVLPKPVRDELQLLPGDSLEMEVSEDRIVLRPARNGRMRKVKGVWVFDSGGGPISAEVVRRTLNKVRRDRERKILGSYR